MEVVFAATDPTDPTLVTVKHLFLDAVIIPKVTILAVVLAEHLTTSNTVTARRLSPEAHLTDNFLNLSSVDLVRSPPTATLCLVVAMPAPERLPTAWCYNATTAAIVAATLSSIATHKGWAAEALLDMRQPTTATQSCVGSQQ